MNTPGKKIADRRFLAASLAVLLGACAGGTETGGDPGTGGSANAGVAGSGSGAAGSGAAGVGTPGSAGAGSGAAGSSTTGSAGGGGSTSAGSAGAAGSGSGSSGSTGAGGTTGSAGSSGGSSSRGGTTGSAGSGIAGAGGQAGGGGAGRGGSGGTTGAAGRGGTTGAAGNGNAGTTGTGGQVTPGFSRPAGKVWNTALPASMTNVPKASWQDNLISPTENDKHHVNQAWLVNGYLIVGGNEEFWIEDVSDPTKPKELSHFTTPGGSQSKEAESHTLSAARYGDKYYLVTTAGTGIDTWDITTPTAVKHLGKLTISGVNYGDYTEAVWGLSWQGQYIYVGATNNGVKIVDATDPAALKIVKELSTSSYGGVSAGPVDVIGNVLVVMTPKENAGIATIDVSDPANPVKLASFTSTTKSYISQFFRHYAFMLGPIRVWDVLSNPKSIGTGTTPLVSVNNEYAEYMAFGDDFMYIGHARTSIGTAPGATKYDISNIKSFKQVNRIWGRMDAAHLGINDDQFPFAFGNILYLGDDQSPYYGWVLAVHQAEPDAKTPTVDTVIPKDGTTGVSIKSGIGISFSDNIELATVNGASFIVRPMGGQALPGKYGVRMGVVNFDPDGELQPGTTYEVVLPKGGLTDLVGNAVAAEWKSTFTTAN